MVPDQPLDTDQWAAREARRSRRRRSFVWALGLTPVASASALLASWWAGPAAGLALGVAAALMLGVWRHDTALFAALGCGAGLMLCSVPMVYTSDDGLSLLAVLAALVVAPFAMGLVLLGALMQGWEQARGSRRRQR
jgi:hypothetical protein